MEKKGLVLSLSEQLHISFTMAEITESRKTIYFSRHAESMFHAFKRLAAEEGFHGSPHDYLLIPDCPLSKTGETQTKDLGVQIRQLPQKPELCVVSPFARTLQTCLLAVQDLGIPVICVANLRELRCSPSDYGTVLSALRKEYEPRGVQFDANISARWWYDDGTAAHIGCEREPQLLLEYRMHAFRHWLSARPERTILVVGHSISGRMLVPSAAPLPFATLQPVSLSPPLPSDSMYGPRCAIVVLGNQLVYHPVFPHGSPLAALQVRPHCVSYLQWQCFSSWCVVCLFV